MSQSPHVADAEADFKVVNITPDFCNVEGKIVPFDIFQTLVPEHSCYAQTVNSRGVKVLTVDSVIKGVIGNAGSGVLSGVSQDAAYVKMITGAKTVFVEKKPLCRHGDLCLMNQGGG